MTTSTFTKDGLDFVDRIEGKKVVLIDGGRLADLMIEHNLGVTTTKVYELKGGLQRLLRRERGIIEGLAGFARSRRGCRIVLTDFSASGSIPWDFVRLPASPGGLRSEDCVSSESGDRGRDPDNRPRSNPKGHLRPGVARRFDVLPP